VGRGTRKNLVYQHIPNWIEGREGPHWLKIWLNPVEDAKSKKKAAAKKSRQNGPLYKWLSQIIQKIHGKQGRPWNLDTQLSFVEKTKNEARRITSKIPEFSRLKEKTGKLSNERKQQEQGPTGEQIKCPKRLGWKKELSKASKGGRTNTR